MSIKLLKCPQVRKSLKYSEIVNYRITLGIVITPNPQFLELLKYPQAQKLQNCPHTVKLLKYPCLSMVTVIWSTLARKHDLDTFGQAKFNGTGSELQRVATTPKPSSTAVNFQQLTGGETMTPGGYGWSEMEVGVMRNKNQLVVSPKTSENPSGANRNSRGFSSFVRRRSGCFSAM